MGIKTVSVSRFDVFLVALDPTRGKEIKKTSPCIVVSPDELNNHIQTVIIAPMTTVLRDYPTRVKCSFGGKEGQVVLDQIRTIDKGRLVKRVGTIDRDTGEHILKVLVAMFSL